MQPISAVIITLNEEKKIGRCIDSLQKVADEVVVVDSLSEDKTKEICLEKGVRFIEHPFEGYIEQKNYALGCATYDYVLSLDADEALSEELSNSILREKESGLTAAGYTMNRLTFFAGKPIRHSGWYPDRKLRLFNKTEGRWQGLNPHDEFKFFKTLKTKHLQGDLLHYSFDIEEDYLQQSDRFAGLSAEAYFQNDIKSSFFKRTVNPAFRFIRDYFFKKGVLHGRTGFKISLYNARATRLKYEYLHQLQKTGK